MVKKVQEEQARRDEATALVTIGPGVDPQVLARVERLLQGAFDAAKLSLDILEKSEQMSERPMDYRHLAFSVGWVRESLRAQLLSITERKART